MAIRQLITALFNDRMFWLAVLGGPFFWFSLHASGVAVSGPAWLLQNPMLFVQLALLYPIVEELVFRGLLQERLWQTRLARLSVYCLSLPNIVTSLMFTALHFLSHPPGWALLVMFPSLVFGYLRDRHQHVLPAVVLHVFYNSGYFLLFGK